MSTKHKILIVEDDNDLRNLYNDILNQAGYDVQTAIDGEEGLTKAAKGGYDLILLDVMMPKKTGLDVLHGLKEKPPASPNKKIILITNLASDPIIKDAIAAGAAGFLIKSDITPDVFESKVKGYLS